MTKPVLQAFSINLKGATMTGQEELEFFAKRPILKSVYYTVPSSGVYSVGRDRNVGLFVVNSDITDDGTDVQRWNDKKGTWKSIGRFTADELEALAVIFAGAAIRARKFSETELPASKPLTSTPLAAEPVTSAPVTSASVVSEKKQAYIVYDVGFVEGPFESPQAAITAAEQKYSWCKVVLGDGREETVIWANYDLGDEYLGDDEIRLTKDTY